MNSHWKGWEDQPNSFTKDSSVDGPYPGRLSERVCEFSAVISLSLFVFDKIVWKTFLF